MYILYHFLLSTLCNDDKPLANLIRAEYFNENKRQYLTSLAQLAQTVTWSLPRSSLTRPLLLWYATPEQDMSTMSAHPFIAST